LTRGRSSPQGRLQALPARWRSGYAEDCKSLHAGSIPARASTPSTPLPHGRSMALIAQSRDCGPPPPPPLGAVVTGRFFAAATFLTGVPACAAGVIADVSTALAPAMTIARQTEGDFARTFTHTAKRGSDWPARPSSHGRPPSRSRCPVRPPPRRRTALESAKCAGRSR
jgi:hypothetical protein